MRSDCIIDLNADIGEYQTEAQQKNEIALLQYVTSCNIACGGHAGDMQSMLFMMRHAKKQHIVIGAHPSYPDKLHFGRRSIEIDHHVLRESLIEQLHHCRTAATEVGVVISHVKPHGAFYNDAMQNENLAQIICDATMTIFPKAHLVGMPNTVFQNVVTSGEIGFIAEGFVDRTYAAIDMLMPRAQTGAVIATVEERVSQAIDLAYHSVIRVKGSVHSINVDTLCLHGDDLVALQTAKAVWATLDEMGVKLRAYECLQ